MFNATIVESSKELTNKERVMYKDTSNATRLDDVTKDGKFVMSPKDYVRLHIENDSVKSSDKEYDQFLIIDKDGDKYVTGSKSFIEAFMSIWTEMAGEEFDIEVFRVPSKNYKGKDFITCSLV